MLAFILIATALAAARKAAASDSGSQLRPVEEQQKVDLIDEDTEAVPAAGAAVDAEGAVSFAALEQRAGVPASDGRASLAADNDNAGMVNGTGIDNGKVDHARGTLLDLGQSASTERPVQTVYTNSNGQGEHRGQAMWQAAENARNLERLNGGRPIGMGPQGLMGPQPPARTKKSTVPKPENFGSVFTVRYSPSRRTQGPFVFEAVPSASAPESGIKGILFSDVVRAARDGQATNLKNALNALGLPPNSVITMVDKKELKPTGSVISFATDKPVGLRVESPSWLMQSVDKTHKQQMASQTREAKRLEQKKAQDEAAMRAEQERLNREWVFDEQTGGYRRRTADDADSLSSTGTVPVQKGPGPGHPRPQGPGEHASTAGGSGVVHVVNANDWLGLGAATNVVTDGWTSVFGGGGTGNRPK